MTCYVVMLLSHNNSTQYKWRFEIKESWKFKKKTAFCFLCVSLFPRPCLFQLLGLLAKYIYVLRFKVKQRLLRFIINSTHNSIGITVWYTDSFNGSGRRSWSKMSIYWREIIHATDKHFHLILELKNSINYRQTIASKWNVFSEIYYVKSNYCD